MCLRVRRVLNWLAACAAQQCAGAARRRAPIVARQLCCAPSARSFRASCLLLSLRPPAAQSHPPPSPLTANHDPAPLQEFASDRVIVSFKPDVVRAMAAEEEGLKFQKPAGLQVGGFWGRDAGAAGSMRPQAAAVSSTKRQWAGHLHAAQQASKNRRRLTVCCCPAAVCLRRLF